MARATKPRTVAEYVRWFASRGAAARNRALSAKQRHDLASAAVTARWQKSTKAERRAAAKRAARARWAKVKQKTKA